MGCTGCFTQQVRGLHALKNSFETILEERKDEMSPRMRSILIGLYGDWMWMDDRIDKVSAEIEEISRTEENCVNVMTVPGIGSMISTAMVAAIGEADFLIKVVILRHGSYLFPSSIAQAAERCWGAPDAARSNIPLVRLRHGWAHLTS